MTRKTMTADKIKTAYASGERLFQEIDALDANLYGADLYGADLYGANLRGARGYFRMRCYHVSSRGEGKEIFGTMYDDHLEINDGCFCGSSEKYRAQVLGTHENNIHAQIKLATLAVWELSYAAWKQDMKEKNLVGTTDKE